MAGSNRKARFFLYYMTTTITSTTSTPLSHRPFFLIGQPAYRGSCRNAPRHVRSKPTVVLSLFWPRALTFSVNGKSSPRG